jgi:hypothetical protein
MAVVITDSSNALWNAALLEPPAGSEKPVPTDEQWASFRSNATTLLSIPTVLLHADLRIAPEGTPPSEGSLAPDAIARLRKEQWSLWSAQVMIIQESAQAALKAIDAKDLDGMMQAGDALYNVCDSCHKLFWYPEGK